MIDALLRDDLYEELVFDLSRTAAISEGMAHELAEVAEAHADRRTARAIRVLAEHVRLERRGPENLTGPMTATEVVDFLNECADRVDPDVNTNEENNR